jgi:hypothetical protein
MDESIAWSQNAPSRHSCGEFYTIFTILITNAHTVLTRVVSTSHVLTGPWPIPAYINPNLKIIRMKRYCLTLTHAALFAGSSLLFAQQPPAPEEGGRPGRNARGPRAGMMPPVMVALDIDKNGSLSANELDSASASLKTLDANNDGQLTADELHPKPPRPNKDGKGRPPEGRPEGRPEGPPPEGGERPDRGGRGEGRPKMKPPIIAVLDADDNKELSAEEIAGATAALKSLDKNNDGEVSTEEAMPRRPRGAGRGPGGPGGPGGPDGPDGPPRGE